MIDLTGYSRLVPPPSANKYWRIFRGRATRSAEANKWLRDMADVLAQDQEPIKGNVRICMVLQEGKGVMVTSDLDNFMKATMDVLQPTQYDEETKKVKRYGAGLIEDDCLRYVRSLRVDVIPEVKLSKSKRGEASWFVKVEALAT
jgi:crossover junction endodeoxyribonuclease RusA